MFFHEISQSPLQTPGRGEGRYGNANGGDIFSFAEGSSRLDLARRLSLCSFRFRCWMVSTKFSRGTYSAVLFGLSRFTDDDDGCRLTRELEKKFSDRHVLFVAQRRILPLPSRRSRVTQKRPRSRTLTAVHDAILHDLVFPTEIVGKRIRTKEDGSKVIKVFLDAKERAGVDYKVDTFGEVYRKLTGKNVIFEFPVVGENY